MTEEAGSAAFDASALEAGTIQTGAFDVSALGGGGQIAGYRVEAEIGHGGMATVYRALDVKLGRRVALKILAPRLAEDESFRKRFIHESRSAAAVDHPNIVPVFEAGESGGVLFIAMRYVGTGDVRTLLERQGSLPVDRAIAICAQVASALDAASAHGLVHRDVKPANMLLAESAEGRADHVYLSDFGLSKHSLAPSGLTATGQFMGTLDYVAPEQIEGRAVDGRADQYALACAAVEMLTGAPPFRRDENIALMWAQLSESPPSLRERRPDLPEAIDRVMSRALAKTPAERYPTCMDFAAALRAAAAGTPTEQSRHVPRPTPIAPLAAAADPGLDARTGPAGPPAQWGRAAAPASTQPVQGVSPSAAPTGLGGRPSAWGQRPPASPEGPADDSGAVPDGAQVGLTGLADRPAAWGRGAQAGSSSVSEPGRTDAASAAWGQAGPPSISQPGQTGAADRPSAWGQSGPASRPSATSLGAPVSQLSPVSPGQPGQSGVAGPAAWGQSGQGRASAQASQAQASASPGSYRTGSPASAGQPSNSPWSASPWPASAAANPASSVSQTGSPAPWSAPPGAGGLYRPGAVGPLDRPAQPDPYRSARVPAPTAPRPKARKRQRGPGKALGIAAVIVVLVALAAVGYKVLSHGRAPGGVSGGPRATATVTMPALTTPVAVVRAYFAAINQHNYRLAWQLGGKNADKSYAGYAHGFAGTKHDTVRIQGHSGDTVRVKIIAKQKNGTRKVFQGFYRVAHHAIVYSHIYRVVFR